MAHGQQINPSKRTILGVPLHPIEGDEILLVEGSLGNTIPLSDDRIFSPAAGRSFYLLVAARSGETATEVAARLRDRYRLSLRPYQPGGQSSNGNEPMFDLKIDPDHSYHYLDERVKKELRFNPQLTHLTALYGDEADWFMISCELPYDREAIFGKDWRDAQDSYTVSTGTYANVRKFDVVQSSVDGVVKVIRRGGIAIEDLQDPDGKPVPFRYAALGDNHIAQENDVVALRTIALAEQENDPTLYLKLNNANANFTEAETPFLNGEARRGRLHETWFGGDHVDFDGIHHHTSTHLTDSNEYYFGKFVSGLEMPVATVPGNHEMNPEGHPPTASSRNFNFTDAEMRRVQDPRYNGPGIPIVGAAVGIYHKVFDGARAIIPDENALIPYYDLINPFQDTYRNLGRGDPNNPHAKDIAMVGLQMNGVDLAHWREDDPHYRTNQQHLTQLPDLHLTTLWEAIQHTSPDLRGLYPQQQAWLEEITHRGDASFTLLMHPPFYNSVDHQQPFNSDPHQPIAPMTPVGEFEDLTYNTVAHPDQMQESVARNSNIKMVLGFHSHSLGHYYGAGSDPKNNIQVYRGQGLEALSRLDENDTASARQFSEPHEGCEPCAAAVTALQGEKVPQLQGYKSIFQFGSAGVGDQPSFGIVTVNSEGLPAHLDIYYVVKLLEPDPGPTSDPNRYRTRLIISKTPLRNDRLVVEWKKTRDQNPQAWLDMSEDKRRAEARLRTDDTSFLPNPQSLNDYPRYNDYIEPRHSFISPTKLASHLRLRFGGTPSEGANTMAASGEYVFSAHQLGRIPRSVLLEGVELGWFRTGDGIDTVHGGIRTPTFLDWMISRQWILRGLGLAVGPGISVDEKTGNRSFYFHDHLTIGELYYHRDNFEIFAGVDRHEFFRDIGNFFSFVRTSPKEPGGDFWGIVGVNLVFP